jgi:hypothetical protein
MGTRQFGTVLPGLMWGIRLSAEKNCDPASEDLFVVCMEVKVEATNPVMTLVPCGFFVLMD